jgi:putative FmdB family regulatory protein
MPTYEYLCQDCSHRFEVWQKMIEEPLTICSECGGHIRRVYYPAGIVFKGSGFYKTDHRPDSSTGSNGHNGHEHGKKDTGESKAAEEKVSSESKPAESGSSGSGTASSPSTSENKTSTGTK